jgi:hypothetical protein
MVWSPIMEDIIVRDTNIVRTQTSDDGPSSVTSPKIRSSSEVDLELQNSKIDSSQIQCQICPDIKYFKNNNGLKIHNSRCHKNIDSSIPNSAI